MRGKTMNLDVRQRSTLSKSVIASDCRTPIRPIPVSMTKLIATGSALRDAIEILRLLKS